MPESEPQTPNPSEDLGQKIEDLKEMHPSDIAEEIDDLSLDEIRASLRGLEDEVAADVITELPPELQTKLLENMRLDRISEIIPEMNSDDAADALGNVSPKRLQDIMEKLPDEEAEEITDLLEYPDDSAGGIMQKEVIAVDEDMNLAQAREAIRRDEDQDEDSSIYVYVVDSEQKLKGVLRLRDLLFRDLRLKARDVMTTDVSSIQVLDDQERIANLFQKYNYQALPVVDDVGTLVGLVTADDVMDVLQEEATEDMQRMVGLSGEEMVTTPWQRSVKNRLPWLCINLGTAFMVAWVVSLFEESIDRFAVLAIFLPIIGLLGGNAGSQTLTIVVRSIALGEIENKEWRRVLAKEILVGCSLGVAIGLLVGVISWLWRGHYIFGIVACVAMMLNMIAAAMAGVLVPIGLKTLKVDPALASSIMVTTVTDVVGFFLFLGLATLAISFYAL